jgi:ABC-type nitrate/sulfonate/bicarbonate transport system substrate-binding protein
MAIRLQESLRGVFYAPFYVALARDAYAAEGVEVQFVSSPQPGDAARNVMDGCLLGRADAGDAGLSPDARLRFGVVC